MSARPAIFAAALVLAGACVYATPQQRVLDAVEWQQRLGARVPLATSFTTANGQRATLGSMLEGKPAALVLLWYQCRNMCGVILKGLAQGLQESRYSAPQDFQVIVVSIDPREGPAVARSTRQRLLGQGAAEGVEHWHLLTGNKEAIAGLAKSVGFTYQYDADTDQYAHPAGITLLTQAGQVSSYLMGVEFAGADLNLALTRAGKGELGSTLDQLVLRCFHFDPETGTYTLRIQKALNLAAGATVFLLAAGIGAMHWHKRRVRQA